MNIEDQIAVSIPVWRKMVEDAGGQWQGVQQAFQAADDELSMVPEPYALFLAPFATNPVSLPVSQMTEENVKAKLGIKSVAKRTQHLEAIGNLIKMARKDLDHLGTVIGVFEEEIKNATK